jgi:hypothetical protein
MESEAAEGYAARRPGVPNAEQAERDCQARAVNGRPKRPQEKRPWTLGRSAAVGRGRRAAGRGKKGTWRGEEGEGLPPCTPQHTAGGGAVGARSACESVMVEVNAKARARHAHAHAACKAWDDGLRWRTQEAVHIRRRSDLSPAAAGALLPQLPLSRPPASQAHAHRSEVADSPSSSFASACWVAGPCVPAGGPACRPLPMVSRIFGGMMRGVRSFAAWVVQPGVRERVVLGGCPDACGWSGKRKEV